MTTTESDLIEGVVADLRRSLFRGEANSPHPYSVDAERNKRRDFDHLAFQMRRASSRGQQQTRIPAFTVSCASDLDHPTEWLLDLRLA